MKLTNASLRPIGAVEALSDSADAIYHGVLARLAVIAIAVIMLASLAVPWVVAESPAPGGLPNSPLPQVATFRCDVTPPVSGQQPLYWVEKVETIEDPLWAKGMVIQAGDNRYVICVVDWRGLCNSSYDLFCQKLAQAVQTLPEHVTVHCVHQHTAPNLDAGAQRLLDRYPNAPLFVDPEFVESAAERVAEAARQSLTRLQPFNRVGIGQAKVERVASARRVWDESGKLFVRFSAGGRDPKMRELPEGKIDPWLKTVTLAQDNKPIVRLHYYATHPQSFYLDRRVSADVPGFARERLEAEEGVFQIYLTGCAGDVTFGKYNDGTRQARDELTQRLYAGMRASAAATQYYPADPIEWRTCTVKLPPRTDGSHSREKAEAIAADPSQEATARIGAAGMLAYWQRSEQPLKVSYLRIGPAHIVHLPGEALLEFQLYAQSLLPGEFVAVAAYGDLGPGYICYRAAFQEGGYEPEASRVVPESEDLLKDAIRRVLKPDSAKESQ